MKGLKRVAHLALAMLGLTCATWAFVPGFTSVKPSVGFGYPDLLVRFREEEVSPGEVHLILKAHCYAKYRVSGRNQIIEHDVYSTKTFTVNDTGILSGTLILTPDTQLGTPEVVRYSNIHILDSTNDVEEETADGVVTSIANVNQRHRKASRIADHR